MECRDLNRRNICIGVKVESTTDLLRLVSRNIHVRWHQQVPIRVDLVTWLTNILRCTLHRWCAHRVAVGVKLQTGIKLDLFDAERRKWRACWQLVLSVENET